MAGKEKRILITGSIGFIGYHLAKKMLDFGTSVIAIDNMNNYYDVSLKETRLNKLKNYNNFSFIEYDISNKDKIMEVFEEYRPNIVINLAAQAGDRYSIENPDAYINSNVIGFYNILESSRQYPVDHLIYAYLSSVYVANKKVQHKETEYVDHFVSLYETTYINRIVISFYKILESCRHYPVDHLIYASSSSFYGANKKVPFEETDFVDHPVSLYASTKKSNELMAHTYSHLYDIPATGLRFFTVYGPMGRPDMAYFGFTDKFFKGEPIKIFNNGDFENDLYRDFTYIDDIVEGIERLISKPPMKDEKGAPHKVFNIGNNNPEKLMTFINA